MKGKKIERQSVTTGKIGGTEKINVILAYHGAPCGKNLTQHKNINNFMDFQLLEWDWGKC